MYIYYVYSYLRNKDSATAKAGTPYYIGKGKGDRATNPHRTNSKGVHVPTDKTLIQFIAINLSEHEAHLLERKLIALHGRKDLESGILRNRTDGGDGISGYKHTVEHKQYMSTKRHTAETKAKLSMLLTGRTKSAETKAKMSIAQKGRIVSAETGRKISITKLASTTPGPMLGRKHSEETKAKIKAARAKQVTSDETRAKMSASHKSNKNI